MRVYIIEIIDEMKNSNSKQNFLSKNVGKIKSLFTPKVKRILVRIAIVFAILLVLSAIGLGIAYAAKKRILKISITYSDEEFGGEEREMVVHLKYKEGDDEFDGMSGRTLRVTDDKIFKFELDETEENRQRGETITWKLFLLSGNERIEVGVGESDPCNVGPFCFVRSKPGFVNWFPSTDSIAELGYVRKLTSKNV